MAQDQTPTVVSIGPLVLAPEGGALARFGLGLADGDTVHLDFSEDAATELFHFLSMMIPGPEKRSRLMYDAKECQASLILDGAMASLAFEASREPDVTVVLPTEALRRLRTQIDVALEE